MKIFITGGTGFVGSYLSQELASQGHELTILTRRRQPPASSPPHTRYLSGDPTQAGPWMQAVPEHDWVINLAGASIFARWNEATKKAIYDSRVLTTRNLVAALAAGERRQLFCSTSAPGFYGPRGEETLTEDSPPGHDFLATVAQAWEAEALKAQDLGLRVVITRFGVVLGQGGGILAQLTPFFRYFLGGPAGDGSQWFSWIHIQDLARAFLFLPDHPELSGPVNFTSPDPVRNRELAQALGRALHRPSLLPAPAFVMRLVLGELAEAILTGQKIRPQKLLQAGFTFLYPDIHTALNNLLGEQ